MSDKTVILQVKLSKNDLEALHTVANNENTNASQLVRSLLADYMKKRSSKFDGQIVNGGARPGAGRKSRTA